MSGIGQETNNIRYVTAGQHLITMADDIINCDSAQGAIILVLPNISGSGILSTGKCFKINDTANTAATNNITLVGTSGNKINDGATVIINTNGQSGYVKCLGLNDYIYDAPSSGGGGGVQSVVAGTGITVDNTDPANPVVALPYKSYVALLTQTGTNAPTAVVLENTLGISPVYAYGGVGSYTLTSTGTFVLGKTYAFIQNNSTLNVVNTTDDAPDIIYILTNSADDLLISTTIEIRVYN